MPIYTGKGVPGQDGFEMKEFQGMYSSPCGRYFSSKPWTKEDYNEMRRAEWKKRIQKLRKG